MAFQLPQFNLSCNIWHAGWVDGALPSTIPPGGAPSLTTDCQLYLGPKQEYQDFMPGPSGGALFSGEDDTMLLMLRVPKGTDLRAPWGSQWAGTPDSFDVVECPAGSKRWYICMVVEDAHKGFTNEYRVGFLKQAKFTGSYPIP